MVYSNEANVTLTGGVPLTVAEEMKKVLSPIVIWCISLRAIINRSRRCRRYRRLQSFSDTRWCARGTTDPSGHRSHGRKAVFNSFRVRCSWSSWRSGVIVLYSREHEYCVATSKTDWTFDSKDQLESRYRIVQWRTFWVANPHNPPKRYIACNSRTFQAAAEREDDMH